MLDNVQTLAAFPTATWTHIRDLGRGGQSETALYRHAHSGELAAIKRLHARHVTDLKQLELFFREGAVLRTLDHPGIPRVLDVFVVRDGAGPAELYIAQTFFEGQNLLDHLASSARPSPTQLYSWLDNLLEIINYLHTRLPPVFHRDIKPSNIIIAPDGRATLIDFGAVATGWARTDASTVVGTPGYTAPEQFSGVVGARTDLYSLGAVAWEIATGRTPTVDQDTGRLLVPDGLDYGLAGFIRATTSTIPSERPLSAAAARALLAVEAPAEALPPRPRSSAATKHKKRRRRKPANASSINALFEGLDSIDPDTNSADDDDGPGEEEPHEYVEPVVIRPIPKPLPFELPMLPPAPRPTDGEFRELFVEMVTQETPSNPWNLPTILGIAGTLTASILAIRGENALVLDALPFVVAAALASTGAWLNRRLGDLRRRLDDPAATTAGRLFVHGTMTTARVLYTSFPMRVPATSSATIAIVFATPTEAEFHANAKVPGGFVPYSQVGDTIAVVYDPEKPWDNRVLPWY